MQVRHRERKKAATRGQLAAEARARFSRKGFSATTVDEIADAAGVSRRTFFRYFPTKEAAVFPGAAERVARFSDLLATAPAGVAPFDRIRSAAEGLAPSFAEGREELLLQWRLVEANPSLLAVERQIDLHWEDTLFRALTEHTSLPAFEARVTAAAVVAALRTVLRTWLTSGGDLVRLGREALDLLARGLADPSPPDPSGAQRP